ncbi:trigger factor [Planctomycetia bacterium]|jgi:trigger factor|nr:trigger factor [Planctomycetia bacterium]
MSSETTAVALPETETPKPLRLDVAIDKVSTCERRVKVTIPPEDIVRYQDEALGDLVPTALLPGFRPGRAPRRLVGSRFKSELSDQIRSKLLTDALTQVSEQEKLTPISEPELDVNAVLMPDDGPMTFEFSIEVRPEFDLPAWKGLAISRPAREISAADVDEAVMNLLRERGRFIPHDGPPVVGDLIVADVRCSAGDRLLAEAGEVEIIVRPRLSFADAELAKFDALVKEARPGTTVTATVRVSDEAALEDLRGTDVTVEFKVLEVKKFELPPLTPALLEEIGGFESEEAVRGMVRSQLEQQLEWHRRRQVRQQVASALTASAGWDLPPALLRRQAQREMERSILELRRSGFDDDAIRRFVNELRQTVMASTSRALKEHFILERIAEEEGISDAPADYDEEIRAIAVQAGESPRRVRAGLERRGLMDVLRNQIIERKTIDLVTSHATFKDTPFEFGRPDAEAIDLAVCGAIVGEEEIPAARQQEPTARPGVRG